MHNVSTRANTIITFAITVLGVLAALNALSSNLFTHHWKVNAGNFKGSVRPSPSPTFAPRFAGKRAPAMALPAAIPLSMAVPYPCGFLTLWALRASRVFSARAAKIVLPPVWHAWRAAVVPSCAIASCGADSLLGRIACMA
jgi:hypothetical protein